jgi:hypothetical protein
MYPALAYQPDDGCLCATSSNVAYNKLTLKPLNKSVIFLFSLPNNAAELKRRTSAFVSETKYEDDTFFNSPFQDLHQVIKTSARRTNRQSDGQAGRRSTGQWKLYQLFVCLFRGIYRLSRQSLNHSVPTLVSDSIFARLMDLKFVNHIGKITFDLFEQVGVTLTAVACRSNSYAFEAKNVVCVVLNIFTKNQLSIAPINTFGPRR